MPFTGGKDLREEMRVAFQKLESLRLHTKEIQEDQVASLEYFAHDVGYQHYKGKNKISVSSTATCVLSLVATGSWKAGKAATQALLEGLISKKTSAGLPDDNPFTVAWILEALTALQGSHDPLRPETAARVEEMEKILQTAVENGKGGVAIHNYPPSAYLTQLVVRALKSRSKLTEDLEKAVSSWGRAELPYQIGLVQANSKTADAFAVAYLVMLVTAVTSRSETTPEETAIQRTALKVFFDCQRQDGTWPLSRPLFHYEKFGNAYCYEYEMLTQLLSEPRLENLLLDYLPNLNAAVEAAYQSAYSVKEGVQAWTSGHHPQLKFPESWATASVYHFVHMLDRLVAEAVRRKLFHYLDLPFPEAATPKNDASFAEGFLDSVVNVRGKQRSLTGFLWEEFVKPLADESNKVSNGGKFKRGTPISAIFFGPPGTSKTELSKKIADFLGWPLVAIDPSHLLRSGMDGIQAEANTIFRMLAETERVVVLFDEFDEFVRERGSSDAEQFSRLLTTAMLPKLASIHKRATLVFIIATNNIRQFDLAIQRPGRFDRVVQIMPPIYEAKTKKKDWGIEENVDIEKKFGELGVKLNNKIKQRLGDLTYLECDAFATELAKAQTSQEAIGTLDDHWERCILRTIINQDENTTWADRCEKEKQFNR
ncbi:MAG: ATP-binding protein [Acidobacteriia bacterium]|nr:ATP-binding protein [Terriglobia bacterium]